MIATNLTKAFGRIPGFGPRSARRAVLYLLSNPHLLDELIESLSSTKDKVSLCIECGNIDEINPCGICQDASRNHRCICIVSSISDLWAIERSGTFNGVYHILGGIISPLHGMTSAQLNIDGILTRIRKGTKANLNEKEERGEKENEMIGENDRNAGTKDENHVDEVIIAVCATLDGQTTAYYLSDLINNLGVKVTRLAFGIPVGAELDYMDDGTLTIALNSRSAM